MVAQAHDLVVEVALCEGFRFLVVDAAEFANLGVAAVVFPLPLAAEAHEGHDAEAVAEVVDGVVLAPDILEAHAVEAHVGHEAHLLADAFLRVLHEDVVCPAGGFDEHGPAVEVELPVALVCNLAGDGTDAEADALAVRRLAALLEGGGEVVKLGLAHLAGPPDAGLGNLLPHFHQLAFPGSEADGGAEAAAVILALEDAADGSGGAVDERGADDYGSLAEVRRVYLGLDIYVLHLHVGCGNQLHGTEDAHGLVYGTGVPVYVAVVKALVGSAVHPYGKGVDLLGDRSYIEFADDEDSGRSVCRRYAGAVDLDVC